MIALWRRDGWIRPASGLDECGDRLDRALIAVGIDARVVASVRADLTDEFDERLARDGVLAAQAWYVCEGVRSLLALARYAVMLSQRNRNLAAAAVLLASATTALVIRTQRGAPDQLLLGAPTLDGALVINGAHGEQIPVRVVDARSQGEYAAGHVAGAVHMDGFGNLPRAENGDMGSPAEFARLVGGLGIYTSRRYRTPYLHIDVRGKRSRWRG